nr:LysR family transcriptional regulator [uncultured Gellertiella sp.]
MDRLHQMEVFVVVADAGSFARAADRLNISPPAVTRAVAALEDRLGTRLLNRTTRSLSLTESGMRFLESARRLLGEMEMAEREAAGEVAVPQGHLTVTASVTMGRTVLADVVRDFLKAYPRMKVSVLLLDRVVNLVEEGIDLAVRVGDLPDSSYVARRSGEVRRILVASPAYLDECGRPEKPADLKNHAFIAFTALMPNREWRFRDGEVPGRVLLSPQLEINDGPTAIRAAVNGEGITIALSYMVADLIREKKLELVLEPFCLPPAPVHLVYPHSRLLAAKVRLFLDFATPRIRETLSSLTVAK